jgi:hypothetical protein
MALLLYTSVFLIEKRLLTWQQRQEDNLSLP